MARPEVMTSFQVSLTEPSATVTVTPDLAWGQPGLTWTRSPPSELGVSEPDMPWLTTERSSAGCCPAAGAGVAWLTVALPVAGSSLRTRTRSSESEALSSGPSQVSWQTLPGAPRPSARVTTRSPRLAARPASRPKRNRVPTPSGPSTGL